MRTRNYLIYDVFTNKRFAGNPLALVTDCEGLDAEAMQRIAHEFNLSESVFLLPPENPTHRARIRIFTPAYELPFAGHPTVGAAVALAEAADGGGCDGIFVLEEAIGPVRCAVKSAAGEPAFAEFDLPRLPRRLRLSADAEAIGAALGLGPHEIGFENHRVSFWSAGVSFVTIPVAGLAAAGGVRFDAAAWQEIAPRDETGQPAGAYVYSRETVHRECAFHVRMFMPGLPTLEDPATGSAAAAFAGVVTHFDQPRGGVARYWIEQGLEMGRPSRIRLELEVAGGGLQAARIGGHAVKVAQGSLFA